MKEQVKILLQNLPNAIDSAITEHCPKENFIINRNVKTGDVWDLVIRKNPQKESSASFHGVATIHLPTTTNFRLGELLRQIANAVQDPTPYVPPFTVGIYTFSPAQKTLSSTQGNDDIVVTDRECDILTCLAKHQGQTVSRNDLLKQVWKYQEGIDTHTLETHIYRLRQKMGLDADDAKVLSTQGGGYCLL